MRPIVNVPEEDRAMAIGNIHKNLVTIACGSGDMLAYRQTQTHRHMCSPQYFAAAVPGVVTIMLLVMVALWNKADHYIFML